MKKLELRGVRPPIDPGSPIKAHHLYTVHLGNGTTVFFPSDRVARAFQADVDRFVSAHLNDCNFMLVEAFSAYRYAWFLLDRTKIPRAEDQAREYIESAWMSMDKALAQASGANGWVMAWRQLAQAVASVRLLALLLRDLHRSRNNPVERARMELLIKRSTGVLDELRHFGQDVKGATATRRNT